jgi:hypothetical protein
MLLILRKRSLLDLDDFGVICFLLSNEFYFLVSLRVRLGEASVQRASVQRAVCLIQLIVCAELQQPLSGARLHGGKKLTLETALCKQEPLRCDDCRIILFIPSAQGTAKLSLFSADF